MDIITMLNELTETRAQLDLLQLDKQRAIDSVLTSEIKAQLADIDAEFADKSATATDRADEIEKRIKDSVKAKGETVKATRLQAVFMRRTSWDSGALTGYAAAHPEIEAFKRVSESVSIRIVK